MCAFIALLCTQMARGQINASLEATVLPGELTIVPSTVNGPWTPLTGSGISTGSEQIDAVRFLLYDIRILDLNTDGLGFRLTATPGELTTPGSNQPQRRTMTIGTVPGFQNPSDAVNTTIIDANTIVYGSSAGVSLDIDYEIFYTIPRLAWLGTYTGTIAFAVTAE